MSTKLSIDTEFPPDLEFPLSIEFDPGEALFIKKVLGNKVRVGLYDGECAYVDLTRQQFKNLVKIFMCAEVDLMPLLKDDGVTT